MNIFIMLLLGVLAADLIVSSLQTERYYMRQRTVYEATAMRVVNLIYAAVLIAAIVVIS